MKTVDKLAHKYALNIKQIRGPVPTKLSDYKNINRGFYDEIEEDSQNILHGQKNLKSLKKESLKEFIYTNKEIPEKWKQKMTYKDDLLDILTKDKKLLTYIGTSPPDSEMYSTIASLTNLNFKKRKSASTKMEKTFPNINNRRYTHNKSPENQNTETKNKNSNKENKLEININDNPTINKTSKLRNYMVTTTKNYNEKEIYNILEDFKTAYPIKEKLDQLYTSTNYYNNAKNISNSTDKKNETGNSGNIFHRTNNSMYSFQNMLTEKRQNVFRQNVFNNLIRTGTLNNSTGKYNFLSEDKSQRIRHIYDSDHENFMRRVEVKDPVIKKNLEGINFYGPYFSHCPPCRNRNLEYYNKLEPNQCLAIIHQIKRVRVKKNLMDIARNNEGNTNNKIEAAENLNLPTEKNTSDRKSFKSDRYEDELRDNCQIDSI